MNAEEPPRKERRKLRKAVLHNVVFRALSQGVVALTYVFLVRAFTEKEFGIYQLFYTVPPFISAAFSLGITVTLSRYLPEYFGRHEFGMAHELLSWAKRLRLVTSVAIIVAIIAFWDSLAPFFKIQDYKNYFYLFGAIAITHFQCRLLNIALSSYLLQQWSMGLTAMFSLAKLVGYGLVLLVDFSLQSALIVDFVAYILWYVSMAWAYRQHVPQAAKERMPPGERKRVLRFGLFNNFNDVGTLTLNARSDNLFIAAFMDPASVGAYAFCTQLEQMVEKLLPTRFFGQIVRAVVFKLDYRREASRIHQYFVFLLKVNFLCVFPIFVTIAAIPHTIITVVFGGKFVDQATLLVVVFSFALITTFQQPVAIIAELGERAGVILASKMFAVYNVIAILVLVPKLGLLGAAIATGTAILFKNLFIWYSVRSMASFFGTFRFFVQQSVLWAACWLILHLVDTQTQPILSFAIAIPTVAVTTIASLRLADFSTSDREIIGRLGGSRLGLLFRIAGIGT